MRLTTIAGAVLGGIHPAWSLVVQRAQRLLRRRGIRRGSRRLHAVRLTARRFVSPARATAAAAPATPARLGFVVQDLGRFSVFTRRQRIFVYRRRGRLN